MCKKLCFLVLSLILVTGANAALIHQYQFSEGAGTIAADSIGSSDANLAGPAEWVAGKADVSGAAGTAISLPATSGMQILDGFEGVNNAITVSVWFKGQAISPIAWIFLASDAGSTIGGYTGPSLLFNAGVGWNDQQIAPLSASEKNGCWNLYTFTKDVSTGTIKIYVNSVLKGTRTGMTEPINGSKPSIKFTPIAGVMDDFRVYDTALSQSEVNALFEQYCSWDHNPVLGKEGLVTPAVLTWKSGKTATSHRVYIGTDAAVVGSATTGYTTTTSASYNTGTLALEKVYYWRVDEVAGSTVYKGDVLSFTTWDGVPADEAMKVWYKLDEGSGTTTKDWSKNGNTGTLNGCSWIAGAPSAITQEATNNALDMRVGTGTVATPAGVMSAVTTEFSLALWANHDGTFNAPYGGTLCMSYGVPATNLYMAWPWLNANQILFGLHPGWGDQCMVPIPAETVGSWNHWTFTKNCAPNTGMRGWLNGDSAVATLLGATTPVGPSTTPITFGNAWVGNFDGCLDDIRVYNIELDEGERLRNAGKSDPKKAYRPAPKNNSTGAQYTAGLLLKWMPGDGATSHNVLFGTKPTALAPAAGGTGLPKTTTQLALGALSLNNTYYWRVDEVSSTGTTVGDVWSFTTVDHISVDNFESYADNDALRAAWVVQNGLDPAYNNLDIDTKHAGAKAMRLEIQNQFDPYVLEVKKTFSAANWTTNGVKSLGVWVKGNAENADQPIYLKLTDATHTGTVTCPSGAFQDADWQLWRINLADAALSSVNKAAVTSITIGIGDGEASGQLEDWYEYDFLNVDDIAIYPSVCVAEFGPPCDVTGDCAVDGKDLKVMSEDWLVCTTPFVAGCEPVIAKPAGVPANLPKGGIITPIPAGGITVDGDLSEWNSNPVTWHTIKKPYAGYNLANIWDIEDVKYALLWDAANPTNLYVAAKVRDTVHYLVDTISWASVSDLLELRVEANGTFGDIPYGEWFATQNKAQFYNINKKASSDEAMMCWGTNVAITTSGSGQGFGTTAGASLDPADPCVICYEVMLRTFSYYGGLSGVETTYRDLAPGVVIAFDIQIDTLNPTFGAVFTWAGWQPVNPKGWLPFVVTGQPTVCGDWGYADTDFNEDCKVDLKDYAVIAGDWLEKVLWP